MHRKPILSLVVMSIIAFAWIATTWNAPKDLVAGDPPPCAFRDGTENSGICCELTGLSLPAVFPAVDQQIRYFTWNNCRLARNKTLCVSLSRPMLALGGTIGCGTYQIPMVMRTCGGQELILSTGVMFATHARTFVEQQPGGQPETQVWRFLWNGDLEVAPFLIDRYGTNPHLPQCYSSFGNKIHFFGYVDCRRDCTTQQWEVEWVLDHECDRYHHNQGSSREGSFHAGRSFNFAGPSTFTPSTSYSIVDTDFDHSDGGIRRIEFQPDLPAMCYRKRPLLDSAFVNLGEVCACSESGDPQYSDVFYDAETFCGYGFSSGDIDKITTRKKTGWFPDTSGNPERTVSMFMGNVGWTDPCGGGFSGQWLEGVEVANPTVESFQFTDQGSLVPIRPNFLDFGSSNVFPTMEGVKGEPHVHRYIVNLNR